MIQTVADITLDVSTPVARPITIYAKQFDSSSRYICVHVTDNGIPMYIESNSAVFLGGRRSDKKKKSFAGTVNTDGTLMLPIDSWLLQLVGSVECDVVIRSDDAVLTTMSFMLVVLESSASGGSEDDEGSDDSANPVQPQYEIASLSEVKTYLEV